MTKTIDSNTQFGVAIIGMAGRFPGAKNPEELWQNLCEGVESITFFDNKDLDISVSDELKNNPDYVKARGTIEDVDKFDAGFFNISPREALIMEPQQRLFLECAWEALEDAGYNPDIYKGLISVYGGTGYNTYFANILSRNRNLLNTFDEHQVNLANAPDYLATRVSYKLNLRGPSVSLYTGCSLSLVAVCHGFDSLMNYQCDMALAGGSFVHCPQNSGYIYQEGEIVSSDGHCRPFDSQATGTVFSNGVGIVLLKRLEDAINDGDQIYAIIRGTAMNNDGSDKVSFTAPSVAGQAGVIAMAQANAGISPDTITYIETHGTGTYLGDTIEIEALKQAFGTQSMANNKCAIGSIKANIGHLDAAAGVAGLIKTALMLKNKKLPPSINFEKLNPDIDLSNSPFYVNTTLSEWKSNTGPLRAGVSSFGVGGTNAHVVVEEPPKTDISAESRQWQLLLLSAKSEEALDRTTTNLARYLKNNSSVSLPDIAFTLQVGRKAFSHRRILVGKDTQDVVNALATQDKKRLLDYTCKKVKPEVAFIFSGQGSQYVNMGRELYQTESFFQEQIDKCSEILKPHLQLDIRDIMYSNLSPSDEAAKKLMMTSMTQPTLFTIEYALAKLWMSWGIHPTEMVGHSIGEYVAACLAGVFTLEDALGIVAARGRLIQQMPGGVMLAVFLSEEEIQPLLNKNLSLAVINGPSLCVISGKNEDISVLEKQLSEKNIITRRLHTSHAFHSTMMEPILDDFAQQVEKAKLDKPQILFLSNVTGTWITPEEATNPAYWAKHLRQTVRFSDCLHELLNKQDRVILEVGPGNTFSTLAKQHPTATKERVILATTRHPKEQISDVHYILNTLGQLWLAGIDVEWPEFYKNEERRRISLPTYPFERQRYWVEHDEESLAEIPPLSEDDGKPQQAFDTEPVNIQENNIEKTLAKIWEEVLGVKDVKTNDNFFELGGHSLMAVQIFNKIEKIFGKKLPIATLYQASTIDALASIISSDKEVTSWKCLVEMKSGDSEPPLYLVHAGGGNVLIYYELLQYLRPEQKVYGLQSQGLNNEQPFHTNIEDMATEYLQEIQNVQPAGPYLIGGFCMGGTVALEMAQQLRAQGQEVAMLLFMETYNWSNMPSRSAYDHIYYYLQKVHFNLGRLFSGEKGFVKRRISLIKEKIAPFVETIKSKNKFKFDKDNGYHSLLYLLEQTNDRAANEYVPRNNYPWKIINIVPAQEYKENTLPEVNWNEIAKGGIDIIELPVYSRQMLSEPFVSLLAEKINESIEKALDKIRK